MCLMCMRQMSTWIWSRVAGSVWVVGGKLEVECMCEKGTPQTEAHDDGDDAEQRGERIAGWTGDYWDWGRWSRDNGIS